MYSKGKANSSQPILPHIFKNIGTKRQREELGTQVQRKEFAMQGMLMSFELVELIAKQELSMNICGFIQNNRPNSRDVKDFCRACVTCQRAKHKSSGREPMREMYMGQGIPGEAMAMDIGILPWTDDPVKGYRYFLLMVDLLQPLRDQEANTLLDAIQQGWV